MLNRINYKDENHDVSINADDKIVSINVHRWDRENGFYSGPAEVRLSYWELKVMMQQLSLLLESREG